MFYEVTGHQRKDVGEYNVLLCVVLSHQPLFQEVAALPGPTQHPSNPWIKDTHSGSFSTCLWTLLLGCTLSSLEHVPLLLLLVRLLPPALNVSGQSHPALPNFPDYPPVLEATEPRSSRDITRLHGSSSSKVWQKLLSFLMSPFSSRVQEILPVPSAQQLA